MHNQYVLTLAAIESRLYTYEDDSIFFRWPTAEKELPRGNHTAEGLSETCLHFMEDILTRSGRPNRLWDNFLFVHFGGWDLLMDYVRKDTKRRGYLLRCEEKGYSVSEDRKYFDEAMVKTVTTGGGVAVVPSTAMECILAANIYLVRNFCGLYSEASMDSLCREIRQFLETGSDEEKGLDPQMNPQDRYCIFMYIRSCLDQYEKARDNDADADLLSRHLGTALAWLVLAALLRDSCENLCKLIPSPNIQLLRVQIREAQESPVPAIAPLSLPPAPANFLGREQELAEIDSHFSRSGAPFFITGEGACGKTSLAAAYAGLRHDRFCIYAVYSEDLRSTVASIRFRDTLPISGADTGALYQFNISRITQAGSRLLIILDNFDAPGYDRTYTELLSQPIDQDTTNADIMEELIRTGARLLITGRASAPPQYASVCLSDPGREFSLQTLLALSKRIYTDCRWTEEDEVLMSRIILAAGKHVMLVELLCAALQQQSGFSSPKEVLDKLESLRLPEIEGNVASARTPAAAHSVYELMRRIFSFSSYDKETQQLLRQLSLLSPLGMDKDLFMQIAADGQGARSVSDEIRRSLLRLRDLHLVTLDPRTAHISMHPVLADVAAADLKPDHENCEAVIENAIRYFDLDSTANYDARALAQISAMCRRCLLIIGDNDSVICARLSLSVSRIEYRLGNYRSALDHACRAYEAAQSAGKDSPASPAGLTIDALISCAGACVRLGLYDEARSFYENALDLLIREEGPTSKETAEAWNDLGAALQEMGRCKDAMDCLMRAYEIQEELFGVDSLEISSTVNNLGMVYADLGDLEKAELCYRHALDISLKFYGPDHPDTAVSCGNLGELYTHFAEEYEDERAGYLKMAREYFERALRIHTAAFGSDYPENACTLSNLGILEDMEGNYAAARSNYKKALRIQSSIAGPEHPHCADILHNMSVSCIDEAFASDDDLEGTAHAGPGMSLLRQALELDSRALSIARRTLGEDHSMTEMLTESVKWLKDRLGKTAD